MDDYEIQRKVLQRQLIDMINSDDYVITDANYEETCSFNNDIKISITLKPIIRVPETGRVTIEEKI